MINVPYLERLKKKEALNESSEVEKAFIFATCIAYKLLLIIFSVTPF